MSDDVLRNRVASIIESLSLIERRMAKIIEANDFVSTEEGLMIMDSIAIRLQVIGETAKKIDLHFPNFRPSIGIDPKPIIRFRDFISHHYDEADFEVLFEFCTLHLPTLKSKIEKADF